MKITYHNPNDNWYYNQRYDNNSVGSMRGCFYSLLGVIILIIISLFLSGCKTQYVPVEIIRTEYINRTDTFIQKDSIHYTDSIVIERKGDTIKIIKTKYIYKDRWQFKSSIDTVTRVDSIQVPYPVERKLTKWEQTKMDAGGIAIGICIAVLLMIIIVFIIKAHRKN